MVLSARKSLVFLSLRALSEMCLHVQRKRVCDKISKQVGGRKIMTALIPALTKTMKGHQRREPFHRNYAALLSLPLSTKPMGR